jgi:formate-dependent nitrite reductase membrane component NrfD
MREELITSGRMNPNIDPVLHIWHWHIPFYLFVGGLAAGLLFFAAYYVITGKDKNFLTAVKIGPIIALFAIVLGLIALVLDLKHPAYFWQLYTTIRLESPMSWGAWTLLIVFFINVIWIFTYLKELFPNFNLKKKFFRKIFLLLIKEKDTGEKLNWEWKYKFFSNFENYSARNRKAWAWVLIIFALILGVYTGILLSAFNARPLWNTSLLGPLFLTSGLSTGAALLMILSKTHDEKITFSRIDLMLIAIEIFFIIHLFMGFLAGPEVQAEAAAYFLGGDFTVSFWVNVVILGLIIPAILESLELLKFKIPVIVPGLLILYGGFMFRFIMVEAGQVIRYLY